MCIHRLLAAAAALAASTVGASALTIDFNDQTLPSIFQSATNYSFNTSSTTPSNAVLAFDNAGDLSFGTPPSGAFVTSGEWRQFTTIALDLSGGGSVAFDLLVGAGSSNEFGSFENVDGDAESFSLRYSTDGGASFTEFGFFAAEDPDTLDQFGSVSALIPEAAMTGATMLQLVQLGNSGDTFDHWAIDNLEIPVGTNVPVPAALPLMAGGLAALGVVARRRRG